MLIVLHEYAPGKMPQEASDNGAYPFIRVNGYFLSIT